MLITTRHQGLASQSSPHARASPVLGTRISCPQLRTNKPDAAIPRQISSRSQSGLPDVRQLADLITKDAVPTDEEAYNMEQLAGVLQVPVATVKSMAFKRKGLLQLSPGEVEDRVRKVAEIVEVDVATARRMAAIQPALLLETEKTAETLKYGLRAISFELDAPREEVINLILNNQSVLHGRELRLSVADMAHLAMLREPKGRIID